jgi:predicted transcriptional regulator
MSDPIAPPLNRLPPREREIAVLVLERGEATATQIRLGLVEPIGDSAVRSMLRRLAAKGVLRRRKDGRRFLYVPATGVEAARTAALLRVSEDYFEGSLVALVEAALSLAGRASAEPR